MEIVEKEEEEEDEDEDELEEERFLYQTGIFFPQIKSKKKINDKDIIIHWRVIQENAELKKHDCYLHKYNLTEIKKTQDVEEINENGRFRLSTLHLIYPLNVFSRVGFAEDLLSIHKSINEVFVGIEKIKNKDIFFSHVGLKFHQRVDWQSFKLFDMNIGVVSNDGSL